MKARPYTIGVLAVGALLLGFLVYILRGGDHPLALQPELALCEVLDESVWAHLPRPSGDVRIRQPTASPDDASTCAMELEPLRSNNRFERIARGEDADRIRVIASVRVTTRAALWRQGPTMPMREYAQMWSDELAASGGSPSPLQGPWSSGQIFTGTQGQQGVLIEDDGIMIWIQGPEVEQDRLSGFAVAVAQNLRAQPDQ